MAKKSIISFILCALLFFGCFPFSVSAEQPVVHQSYISGSTDGLFHPDSTVSRAEIAQMIFNINPSLNGGEKEFSDVISGAWYEDAVSSLASAGIMNGYDDGTFKPMKAVTRAEFVTVLAALYGDAPLPRAVSFSDVSATHWAFSSIALAESCGWVKGSNGCFRPDDSLTRAEAVTAINRYLGRSADISAVDTDPTARYFPDVTPDKWFYYDVMEASVSHTASIVKSGELWTGITRYKTVLPDGFAVISRSLRLILNGWFVSEQCSGSFGGIDFISDEHGVISVSDGVIPLSGGRIAVIKNGEVVSDDGLYCTTYGLYCIENGEMIRNTYHDSLYFGPDGRYTSGNRDIDCYIDNIVSSVITNDMTDIERLRACYDHIYYNVDYRANNNHVPRGTAPEEWAEENMLRLIDTGKGNCYCYAAFMYYLARRVGFASASAVSGGVTPDDDDHGWATVIIDGETLILDPELDTSSGPYPGSIFLVTYEDAPFQYRDTASFEKEIE